MKKGILVALAVAGFSAIITTSCNTPAKHLSDAEVQAKADSVFNSKKDAKLEELKAACQSTADAQVSAKVEELKAASMGQAGK